MALSMREIIKERRKNSLVKPTTFSHGTCECIDIVKTRAFYEEFLGLECVRISPIGMAFSLGLNFHVVCLQTGDRARPELSIYNHWGVEVESPEEVDDAHAKAHEYQKKYNIRRIDPITFTGGRYSFYFEDLDYNWWEIQYYKGFLHDDFYDFGDTMGWPA